MAWMIYGASGYTGELVARLAKARGHAPVLAGRSADKVRPLAGDLGLSWRAFGLDAPDIRDVALVLNCAGPFSHTSRAMVDACLAARAHYLDVTGEIEVFESVLARDAEARDRGAVLLPGTGFDVVPSDCLALTLKKRLPSATSLELAFATRGRASRGTLKTMIENLPRGGLVRRGGRLVKVPAAHLVREIPFGDKRRLAMSIPWGDISTAYRSTGIRDITVYMSASPSAIRGARLSRYVAPILRLGPVQGFLKARVEARGAGPGEAERARGSVQLWGQVSDGSKTVSETMQVPDGYDFTAEAALACALRVLSGAVAPGAWTPSLAFGPEFAASLPGVRVPSCGEPAPVRV
ncbi:MAG: trans-acting enoyl reductase family protein [Myxococcales bacterium]